MALMAAHGEIDPMPDAAVFADTRWEPGGVYDHLDWLASGNVLPFDVERCSAGDIKADALESTTSGAKGRWASMPWYVLHANGQKGMIKRQCTKEYKLEPIRRALRLRLGLYKKRSPKTPVIRVWIGISTDEIGRMKPSREAWVENRHPLIELGMSRSDCVQWMADHGYPEPPKSACVACPYRSDRQWRDMKNNDPDTFAEAVEFDRAIRHKGGDHGTMFTHRSCQPLDEVDFRTLEDMGQLNMFNDECDGMCGV